MNRPTALEVIRMALASYIEDCAGEGSEEAQQIEEAWQTINETYYYAIWYDSEYITIGLNYTDPAKVKEELLEAQKRFLNEEYIESLREKSLDEICQELGYTLERNSNPV